MIYLMRYSVLAIFNPKNYTEIYLPNSRRTIVMPKSKVRAGDRTRILRMGELYFSVIAMPVFMLLIIGAMYFSIN